MNNDLIQLGFMKTLPVIVNSDGFAKLARPTASAIKKGFIEINEDKVSLRELNGLLGKSKFILINPDGTHIEDIPVMTKKAIHREFIPVFLGAGCTESNFSSFSIAIFESSWPQGMMKFVFIMLSHEIDAMFIEDDVEISGVADQLNNLYAACAGAGWSVVAVNKK